MKHFKWTLAIVTVLSLAVVASGQKPSDIYRGLTYDKTTEAKAAGEVAEVQDFDCPVSKALGNHVVLKTTEGNIVVHIAPVKFMKEYGLEIKQGDKMTVVGSKLKDSNGAVTMLAREITIDNSTLRFRDDKGKPIW